MAEIPVLHQPDQSKYKLPFLVFFKDARLVFKMDSIGLEIIRIALPAAMALAADPIASLIDTAFIGHIGPVELAAVGVSIAIFTQASRITTSPLISITTSFVAEEDTIERNNAEASKGDNTEKGSAKSNEMNESMVSDNSEKGSAKSNETKEVISDDVRIDNLGKGSATKSETIESMPEDAIKKPAPTVIDNQAKSCKERRHIHSASTALVIGTILGILQAIILIFGAKPFLSIMGVKSNSPMLAPAKKYLTIRSLGAPAILLSIAMQGVFRGFKDTKTPLYATAIGDLLNVILDAILIFVCRLGVSGAAIAHVLSQYMISLILLWKLMKQVNLMPPRFKDLQFSRFLKNVVLLLARVIAASISLTLSASMAARLGPTTMAAHQVCFQVWLTTSLLADGLAIAVQAIIACALAEKDYDKVTAAASRVLQMGFVLGLGLAIAVGLGLYFGSGIFSKDANVLHLITIALPFVAATQPISTLAFVFDGINFGASDFAFTAYCMGIVAVASIVSLVFLSKSNGFIGIWVSLTIYMALRMFAGVWRMGTGTGPWKFLRGRLLP